MDTSRQPHSSMEIFNRTPDRVTIQDVADHLGISKATVCRALLNRARVAEDTRKRVEAAAKELGYKPDPALRALSKHRWGKSFETRDSIRIALVEINQLRTGNNKSFHRESAHAGAFARAAELNIQIEAFAYEDYQKSSRLGDVLFNRGYSGVLFSIRGPAYKWDFPWDKFSCVAVSFDHPSHQLNMVCSDWFNAVCVAVEDIRARGYKRPGFLQYTRDNASIDLRTRAAFKMWSDDLSRDGLEIPPVFDYDSGAGADSDSVYNRYKDEFLRWYETYQPDVIIDGGYLAYWWLKDAGLEIPDSVGYLRLRHSPTSEPIFANGVDHRLEEQGRWSIDLLSNMSQFNVRGLSAAPVRLTVACTTREGTTLRPAPGA